MCHFEGNPEDGYELIEVDSRNNHESDWEVDPILSSPNTDFGGDDPAEEAPTYDKSKPVSEQAFYDYDEAL